MYLTNVIKGVTVDLHNISSSPVSLTISRDVLAVEALRVMETHKITSVVVVSDARVVEGVVHLHDLWRTQMF